MECTDERGCPCERCARKVSRRWFLGAAGAIGAGLLLADKAIEVVRNAVEVTQLPPGWSASKEGVGMYRINHTMSAADFRKVIVDGLNAAFKDAYEEFPVTWHGEIRA